MEFVLSFPHTSGVYCRNIYTGNFVCLLVKTTVFSSLVINLVNLFLRKVALFIVSILGCWKTKYVHIEIIPPFVNTFKERRLIIPKIFVSLLVTALYLKVKMSDISLHILITHY